MRILVQPRGRGSDATGFADASRIGDAVTNDGTATLTSSTFDHDEALGGSNDNGGPIAYPAPDSGSGRTDSNPARTDPACGPP